MNTVRRFYFYALALISAEVIVWGAINLLRTIASHGLLRGGSRLAIGLSMVLAGIPIFWLHWRTVQRDAFRDLEERASRTRAVFLYTAIIALELPVFYSILALADTLMISLFGQPVSSSWFGRTGTIWEHLIAILINLVALAYFWSVLRADWQADVPENDLANTRRLYWYVWVLVGLGVTVGGVYNLVNFILLLFGKSARPLLPLLSSGIGLLVVGIPIWAYHWQAVQNSLRDPFERRSLLRLVVLYLLSFVGVVGVLTPAGRVLTSLFRWLMGESNGLVGFLQNNSGFIGAAVPLGILWGYYGQILKQEVSAMPDLPRRAALRRLYHYILAFLGLAITFAGILSLVDFLAQALVSNERVVGPLRQALSGGLSALLIGLPLWFLPWQMMQQESARPDDNGDRARRSILRKAYLYLVLFQLVIGAMGFTAELLFNLLNGLLSGAATTLAQDATKQFLSLLIDVALLLYHWRALREDNRQAQQTLENLHAAFPTLVLQDGDTSFDEALVQSLHRLAPNLPIALHLVERGAPDEAMLGVKAVLLPVGLALKPPESLRLWLEEYHGRRILVPLPVNDWYWLGQVEKPTPQLAYETAQAIRQIAEGESARLVAPGNPWTIAGYVLGGLVGLLLLFLVLTLMISGLFQ